MALFDTWTGRLLHSACIPRVGKDPKQYIALAAPP